MRSDTAARSASFSLRAELDNSLPSLWRIPAASQGSPLLCVGRAARDVCLELRCSEMECRCLRTLSRLCVLFSTGGKTGLLLVKYIRRRVDVQFAGEWVPAYRAVTGNGGADLYNFYCIDSAFFGQPCYYGLVQNLGLACSSSRNNSYSHESVSDVSSVAC